MGRVEAICISAKKGEKKSPQPAVFAPTAALKEMRMPDHGTGRSVCWRPRTLTRCGAARCLI
jgi:hypothetical protein